MTQEEIQVTPLSMKLAVMVNRRMRELHIGPSKFESMLDGEVNKFAIRRIRRGTSGCRLRTYEKVLDALGLQLCVVNKTHPDILD